MPYFVFAWISSIAYGLTVIGTKISTKYQIPNLWLFNFVWAFFMLLYTLPIVLIKGVILPQDWLTILMAGMLYALSGIVYLAVIKLLDVSTLCPLFNLRIVFAVLLGVLFLGESYSLGEYGLIGLILLASAFVTIDEKFSLKSYFNKGIALMFLFTFVLALGSIYVNRSVASNGYWETSLWIGIVTLIVLVGTVPFFKKDLRTVQKSHLGTVAILALFNIVGLLGEFKAISENVGISTVIIALPLSMLMVIVLSRFAPKLLEKHPAKVYAVRLVAAIVMLLATLKLTL